MSKNCLTSSNTPIKLIKNLLGSTKCIACNNINQDQGSLCYQCWPKLNFINNSRNYHNKHIAILNYNGLIKSLIHKLKYQDRLENIQFFSKLIIYYLNKYQISFDYIIPIPIDKKRLLLRKHNQTSLIANKIGKYFNKTVIHNALIKESRPNQTGLSLKMRQNNLLGAFKLNQKALPLLENSKLLLIDDIITTGSTMLECEKALNLSKPYKITKLACAQTPENQQTAKTS